MFSCVVRGNPFSNTPCLYQGFDGPLPTKLEDLTLDSAQITFRKVRSVHSSPAVIALINPCA